MTEIIGLALTTIGELVKIAVEAQQNAQAAEADLLAKLKVTLASASVAVEANLAKLDAARAAADAQIAAGAPDFTQVTQVTTQPSE